MREKKYVRDLMSVGVPTCKCNTPAKEIAMQLVRNKYEAVCVLDAEGNGIGVVGVEELINAIDTSMNRNVVADEIMREGMPTLSAEMPLELAAKLMVDQKTRIAYLIHNAAGIIYPAAYLTFNHLIRFIASENEGDLSDLGIAAERELPLESFIRKRDEAKRRNVSINFN